MMRHKFYQKSKTPSDGTCLGEPSGFLWCWSSFCCCYSSFVDVLHSHFLFDIIPHPSVDYRQVFRPILYFQPSPSQSDLWHFHFSTIPLSSYRKRYGFEWAFFTHRRFLPYAPSQHFWHIPTFLAHSWHFSTTCFYQDFAGSRQLQGFILIFEIEIRPICLFDSQ